MCSRFFIDFSDINQQQSKLENYLYNHFVDDMNGNAENDRLKYEYLMILYQVVDESTVCVMGHERRLTLALIEDMAFQVYSPPYYPIPPPDYSNANNSNRKSEKDITSDPLHADSLSSYDQSSSSAASTCSSMSTGGSSSMSSAASSTSSSGTTTPQKPPTPGPVIQPLTPSVPQQVTHTNYQQIHRHTHSHPPPPMTTHHITSVPPPTTLPAVAITNQPPASVHHVPSTLVGQQQQISSTNMNNTSAVIPTYEIVTSCQPAVIYSNGYYYTSFASYVPSPATTTIDTSSPPPQISGQLPTTATVQQLPSHQQLTVGTQQPTAQLPCTCTCSCNQWPALSTTNQTSTVTLVPAGPPPCTQQQNVSVPPPCCFTQQVVCT